MADRVHPLQEEIDGRLRYDHAGNLFYNEYKPLLDKLYYKVGTETNKEDLQKYRNDLRMLLEIESEYREYHMYRPQLQALKKRANDLAENAERLQQIAEVEQKEKQKLIELLEGMQRLNNASFMSQHFELQVGIYEQWKTRAEKADTQFENISREVEAIKQELAPGYEHLITQVKEQISALQRKASELHDEQQRLEMLRKRIEESIQQKTQELSNEQRGSPVRPIAVDIESFQEVKLNSRNDKPSEIVRLPSLNNGPSILDLQFVFWIMVAIMTVLLLAKW